ncbi:MAG: hypothetical protein R3F05_08945 [Planctomycetota bacterium]
MSRRGAWLRLPLALAAAALVAGCGGGGSKSRTATFAFSGNVETYEVPSGVTVALRIVAAGVSGGDALHGYRWPRGTRRGHRRRTWWTSSRSLSASSSPWSMASTDVGAVACGGLFVALGATPLVVAVAVAALTAGAGGSGDGADASLTTVGGSSGTKAGGVGAAERSDARRRVRLR